MMMDPNVLAVREFSRRTGITDGVVDAYMNGIAALPEFGSRLHLPIEHERNYTIAPQWEGYDKGDGSRGYFAMLDYRVQLPERDMYELIFRGDFIPGNDKTRKWYDAISTHIASS